jgi:endonuclease/exonuclease/phosphatase (EEP) superfamily protein YafD
LLALALGCASIDGGSSSPDLLGSALDPATICRGALATPVAASAALDPSRIRLLNWNVQKGLDESWRNDLRDLGSDADLVLMQEARGDDDAAEVLEDSPHRSFAAGFESSEGPTGVLTLSRVPPNASCRLVSVEPWLRTPKATGITAFALGDGDTLVVVNLHALNFTFGTAPLSEQLEQIRRALVDHDGPLIVSGDFNTWRPARMGVVEAFARALDLVPLAFEDDQRVLVFGQLLDHVYVRGLEALHSDAVPVQSSDHNPMRFELRR